MKKDDRAVLHDPELYPDPEAFKPELFLTRICPGRHFVAATLFVVTASVLSMSKVARATDKDGKDILVPASASPVPGQIVIQVPHFEGAITPRDKIAEDLIREGDLLEFVFALTIQKFRVSFL
ncbi:hypothetical protein V8E53_004289 [Lactarius tabidus]